MKKTILLAGLVAGLFTFTASAQYRPTGDGISASPRLREQMNERKKVAKKVASTPSTAVASVGYPHTVDDGISASPRLREQMNERKKVAQKVASTPSTAVASVGYPHTRADRITASPRLREQLNEHRTQFMVAPLK
jgi:hypothetical protein